MIKKNLSLIFLIVLLSIFLATFASLADGSSCGTNVYYTIQNDGTLTISGTGQITYSPWGYNASIKKLVIQEGVTGSSVSFTFANLANLTEIVFPSSYSSLQDYEFYSCTSLTNVILPATITSFKSGKGAFSHCSNLETLTINGNVTTIGDYFCSNCEKLTTVILPDSLTTIGTLAFFKCTNLSNIQLPDSLETIGDGAFSNCTKINAFTAEIDSKCAKALGKINMLFKTKGENILLQYTMNDDAVEALSVIGVESKDITKCDIPDQVTVIGQNAFSECAKLTKVTVPATITSIGYGAFYGCKSLNEIHFPENISSIDTNVFWEAGSSLIVYVPDKDCDTARSLSNRGIPFRVEETKYSLLYPYNKNIYPETDGLVLAAVDKDVSSFSIPDYVSIIGTAAFRNNTNITTVTIPDSVSNIMSYAFNGCTKLTRIKIPDSVTTIENLAFDIGTVTLEANRGSSAHKYAVSSGFKYACTDFTYIAQASTEDGTKYIQATFDDGATVKAQRDDNLDLNGNAMITYSNSDKYEGNLSAALKSGEGIYTWADGSSYQGEFANDLIEGSGSFTYINDEQQCTLTGSFVKGIIDGEAVFKCDKNVYETVWENGECKNCTFSGYEADGWQITDSDRSYIYLGKKITGWLSLDKHIYYFDDNGKASVGFTKIDDKTYYFDDNGTLQAGSLNLMDQQGNSKYYFFDETGVMQTGFVNVKGQYFYYSKTGEADLNKLTMIGDVNSDSVVDGRDLLRLMKILDSQDLTFNPYNADVNSDHVLDEKDRDYLSQYLTGAIESLN